MTTTVTTMTGTMTGTVTPWAAPAAVSNRVPSPVLVDEDVRVHPGPALLAGPADDPSLGAHRARLGDLPRLDVDELLRLVDGSGVRGRGGAAFPFAIKLRAAAQRRRPVVVVNLSEGEPASSKDSVLARRCPHLVLDGAVVAAEALGAREVHVVLPADRPRAAAAMRTAVEEREQRGRPSQRHHRVRLVVHTADARFVAGQARAVIELLGGRENLPVTAWTPEAVAGHRGRPTLLSNAETWAHVALLALQGPAAYAGRGTADEPGTTLLTVTVPGRGAAVHEVPYGSPLRDVLPRAGRGGLVLVGGFHGTWAPWSTVDGARVSVAGMADVGMALGAGVVLAPGPNRCPLDLTSRIVDYLADQSARRCGPCFNGLPALALAVRRVRDGTGGTAEIDRLAELVKKRGACAHPDGTVRLVASLLSAAPAEIEAHAVGVCASHDRSPR